MNMIISQQHLFWKNHNNICKNHKLKQTKEIAGHAKEETTKKRKEDDTIENENERERWNKKKGKR